MTVDKRSIYGWYTANIWFTHGEYMAHDGQYMAKSIYAHWNLPNLSLDSFPFHGNVTQRLCPVVGDIERDPGAVLPGREWIFTHICPQKSPQNVVIYIPYMEHMG